MPMNYLTPEDYAIAKSNGISRKRAHERFYHNDWSAERAITEPTGHYHSNNYKELLKQAHENGVMITLGGLYQRIYKGMSEEEAVTKPLVRKSKYIEIAESNGIRRQAYYSDRKSTRLNSSHVAISYAVFCLKKKKKIT